MQGQQLRLWETNWVYQVQSVLERRKPYIPHTHLGKGKAATLASGSLMVAGDWFRSSCLVAWQLLLESLGRPRLIQFGAVAASYSWFSLV